MGPTVIRKYRANRHRVRFATAATLVLALGIGAVGGWQASKPFDRAGGRGTHGRCAAGLSHVRCGPQVAVRRDTTQAGAAAKPSWNSIFAMRHDCPGWAVQVSTRWKRA